MQRVGRMVGRRLFSAGEGRDSGVGVNGVGVDGVSGVVGDRGDGGYGEDEGDGEDREGDAGLGSSLFDPIDMRVHILEPGHPENHSLHTDRRNKEGIPPGNTCKTIG